MIIKIKSDSEHFGDILMKNPDSFNGSYGFELKNGVCFGRYVNQNEYHIIFQDTKYSYTRDNSNQLDYMSHCSPNVLLDVFASSAFRHMLYDTEKYKNHEVKHIGKSMQDIDKSPFEINFNCYIDSSWIDKDGSGIFKKYFGQKVEIKREIGYIYNITIKGDNAHETFNLAAIIAMFSAVVNPYKWQITNSLIEKYIRVMNNVDVPYFIIYLFKVRLLHEENFNQHKSGLEKIMKHSELKLTYGNTHKQRMLYIKDTIDLNNDILDYGCGEGKYLKMLGKHMKSDQNYFAHDIEDVESHIKHIAKFVNPEVHFSQVFSKLKQKMTRPVSIIMSEVIEHNEPEMAKMMIERVMNEANYKQIIITTVNRDFNKHYSMQKEMRHEDHHFEMNMDEFKNFMKPIIEGQDGVSYRYIQIGDSIDGVQPTQGFIIEKI